MEVYRQDWKPAYDEWRARLLQAEKKPNTEQWQFLDLVHKRCLYEYHEELGGRVNASPEDEHREPLFRCVHGLPGAGKVNS